MNKLRSIYEDASSPGSYGTENRKILSEQTTNGEMVIKGAVLYITQTRSQEIFSK